MTISAIRGGLSDILVGRQLRGTFGARTQADSLKDSLNINRQSVAERNAERTPEAQRPEVQRPEPAAPLYDNTARLTEQPDLIRTDADATTKRAIEPSKGPGLADLPTEFQGEFKGNAFVFDDRAAALIFGENGEVTAIFAGEGGTSVRGTGSINDEGKIELTFDNGQKFSAQLNRSGDRGTISDIQYNGQNRVFDGVTDGKNFAFSGIYLEAREDGQFDVTLNGPDGEIINGVLNKDENGNFIAKLDNGETYGGTITSRGKEAFLTNLELLERKVPQPQPTLPADVQADQLPVDEVQQIEDELLRPILDLKV